MATNKGSNNIIHPHPTPYAWTVWLYKVLNDMEPKNQFSTGLPIKRSWWRSCREQQQVPSFISFPNLHFSESQSSSNMTLRDFFGNGNLSKDLFLLQEPHFPLFGWSRSWHNQRYLSGDDMDVTENIWLATHFSGDKVWAAANTANVTCHATHYLPKGRLLSIGIHSPL